MRTATKTIAFVLVAKFPRTGDSCLVLLTSVNLQLLQNLKKAYPWKRPECCPRCSGTRLWGHGYVARYFDEEQQPLWMKRWRCPDCGAVHTVRPAEYWRRFLLPWFVVLASLLEKLVHGRWLSLTNRQRQQYWKSGYLKQRQIAGGLAGVEELHDEGIIVATHSLTDRWVHRLQFSTHPSFSSTPGDAGG